MTRYKRYRNHVALDNISTKHLNTLLNIVYARTAEPLLAVCNSTRVLITFKTEQSAHIFTLTMQEYIGYKDLERVREGVLIWQE